MAVAGIDALLSFVTLQISFLTGVPEWALNKEQTKALAEAAGEVSKYYPLPVLKPEHVALGALGTVIIRVGKNQLEAYKLRVNVPKRHDVDPVTGNTTPVPPTAPWVDFGLPPNAQPN